MTEGSIFRQFRILRRGFVESYRTPARVTFSPNGHKQAMRENRDNQSFYSRTLGSPATFMGLPYSVESGQSEDILLHEARRPDRNVVEIKLERALRDEVLSDLPVPLLRLSAQHLTRAQFSDLVQGYIDAHPGEHSMTNMLVDWLQTHGRFE